MSRFLHVLQLSLRKVGVTVLLVAFLATVSQAAELGELKRLRDRYQNGLNEAAEALSIFWRTYPLKVQDLQKTATKEQAFDAALAIDGELKLAQAGKVGEGADFAPLKNLQIYYGRIHAQLLTQYESQRVLVAEEYSRGLEALEKTMRQENRAEDAYHVHAERTALADGSLAIRPNLKIAATPVSAKTTVSANATATASSPPPAAGDIDWKGLSSKVTQSQYEELKIIGNNGGSPYRELPEDGGILIGFELIITPFKDSKTTVRGFKPIFLTAAGQKTGGGHGSGKGESTELIVAKPGYAVGKVTGQFDKVAMRRIKVRFDRIQGLALNSKDNYETKWIGEYPNLKDSVADLKGRLPVGVNGSAGQGINGMTLVGLK